MSDRRAANAAGDPFGLLLDFERRSLAHVAGLPEQFDAPGQWRGLAYRVGERRLASMFDDDNQHPTHCKRLTRHRLTTHSHHPRKRLTSHSPTW